MSIQPIGERVLILPKKEEERTASGIYIPESAQEKKKEGSVIAVGTRDDGKALPIKVGDQVIYGGYSSEEVTFEDTEYVIVEFKNILARIE